MNTPELLSKLNRSTLAIARGTAAIRRADFWKYFLATTGLAEPNGRRVESRRTRSSEANCVGVDRDPSDFLCRSVDLELVFASAETQESFGEDRSA